MVEAERQGGERQVDIAHEALIIGWPLLAEWSHDWLLDEQERRRWEGRTRDWNEFGRADGGLLDRVELAAARRWFESQYARDLGYSPDFEELIAQSQRAIDKEQEDEDRQQKQLRQSHSRMRVARVSVGVLAIIIVIIVLVLSQTTSQLSQTTSVVADQRSRELASLSTGLRLADPNLPVAPPIDLAALLSLESLEHSTTTEARANLRDLLMSTRQRYAFRFLRQTFWSISFGGGGDLLAAGTDTGEVMIWRQDEGGWTESPQPTPHRGVVNALAFDRSGSILASAGADATINIWDTASSKPLTSPTGIGQSAILSLAFNPVNDLLAWGSGDGWIGTWDLQAQAPRSRFCGADGTVHTADESDNESCVNAAGQRESMRAVAFSRDGQIIAGGSDGGTVMLWKQREDGWQPLPTPSFGEPASVSSLAFSPTEQLLAIGSRDAVMLWHPDTLEVQLLTLTLATSAQMPSLAFSADGSLLGVGTDGPIEIFARDEGHWTRHHLLIGHGDTVTGLAFSPTAPAVLASAGSDRNVIIWHASTDPMLAQHPPMRIEPAKTIALNSDGALLGAGGQDGTIQLWAWQDARWQATFPAPLRAHESPIHSLVFSSAEPTMASGDDKGAVLFWNVDTGERLPSAPSPMQRAVGSLAFSRDGQTLAAGDANGEIVLWQKEAGQWGPGNPLRPRDEPITSLAFSPDGSILISGDDGGAILAWNVPALGDPFPHSGPFPNRTVTSVAFPFDDNQTFFWGRADARVIKSAIAVEEHTKESVKLVGGPVSLAISPDRSLIAAGTSSGGVILLDPSNLLEIGPLDGGSNDRIVAIAFSADGTSLVTGTQDGIVTRWDVGLESWQARACAIAGRSLFEEEIQTYLDGKETRHSCSAVAGTE